MLRLIWINRSRPGVSSGGRRKRSIETVPGRFSGRSSGGHSALLEQGKESVAAFRRRFIIIDANPKKFFELATERPVLGEQADAVKICLAHIAPKEKPLALGIKPDTVLQVGVEFHLLRKLLESDEMIHQTLHQ